MEVTSNRTCHGFTLIELLVTLAVSTTLVSIAAPNLQQVFRDNEINARANGFISVVQFARAQALMRNQRTVICPSSDGLTCTATTSWQGVLLVFVDTNKNRKIDADEPVLRKENLDSRRSLLKSTAGRKKIVFNRNGRSSGSNGTYRICDKSGIATTRAVIISMTGRPRVAKLDSDDSGPECA